MFNGHKFLSSQYALPFAVQLCCFLFKRWSIPSPFTPVLLLYSDTNWCAAIQFNSNANYLALL